MGESSRIYCVICDRLDCNNKDHRRGYYQIPSIAVEQLKAEGAAEAEEFHPRAMKLIRKHKNFIVIADDEPYFLRAYQLLREHEKEIDRWTIEDEERYRFYKAQLIPTEDVSNER